MKIRALVYGVILAAFLAAPALAGLPGKTELSLEGSGINLADGGSVWSLQSDLMFPVGQGHVVIGPSFALSDDDTFTRGGVALDWNMMGQKHATFFVGAVAHYFLKAAEEWEGYEETSEAPAPEPEKLDRYTVTARGGLKFSVGPGAFIKLYVEKPVDGRLDEVADIAYHAGIAAKF